MVTSAIPGTENVSDAEFHFDKMLDELILIGEDLNVVYHTGIKDFASIYYCRKISLKNLQYDGLIDLMKWMKIKPLMADEN